jgi:nucleoside phosphorylase
MTMTDDPHGSIGAHRVRETFNPSGDQMVDKLKRYTADLIDLCEELKALDARLAALAQTAYEVAAMFAVKAATTKKAAATKK